MGVFFYTLVYNVSGDRYMTQKIDLVIAYVNNKDTVWRNTYIDYCAEHNCADKLVNIMW